MFQSKFDSPQVKQDLISVMRCAIWQHLYNLKNVKSTHGGVLILVKLQAKHIYYKKLCILVISQVPGGFLPYVRKLGNIRKISELGDSPPAQRPLQKCWQQRSKITEKQISKFSGLIQFFLIFFGFLLNILSRIVDTLCFSCIKDVLL